MKTRLFIMLMIVSSFPALAGFRSKLPVRWGKITTEEFKLTSPSRDSEAAALVLCDYGDVEISNRTFYVRHTRIKILKEAGLQYASLEIPYQTKDKHDVFYDLKAQTFVLENGKIKTYEVKSKDIEDVQIDDNWRKKKITLLKAAPGTIIEVYYRIASLDFEKLDTWYFQREIPTLWSEFRLEVPAPYYYLVNFQNNRQLSADEEELYRQKLQWLYDTRAKKRYRELAQNKCLLFNTPENRYKVWALNNMTKKIVMKNLPGLSAGADGQPVTSFYPQLRIDLFESSGHLPRSCKPLILTTHDDYEERGMWQLMNDHSAYIGYVHYKMKTWPQFNENLLNHNRFGQYLVKRSPVSDLPASILDAGKTDLERMNAVYHYVQKQYTWNGQFAQYAQQDFREFEKKHSGSSAEINLILINLLRQAGINSDPLLIRTSDLGMPEKMHPVKGQFNHVIARVELNGIEYLLDATSDSPDVNRLNQRDIGTQGWLVHKEKMGWIEIFPNEKSGDNLPLVTQHVLPD